MKFLRIFALVLYIILFSGSSFSSNFFIDTRTTALCFHHLCQDYVISCMGEEVVGMQPLNGFVTFGDAWVDRREEKELC